MKKDRNIRFGPAGFGGNDTLDIPLNSKNSTADAIKAIVDIGLEALEIEFVRGVYLKNYCDEKLNEIKNNSEKYNVSLSMHAPYYINLNAVEDYKLKNSKDYIINSLNIGQKIGAKILVTHLGYYLNIDRKVALERVVDALRDIQEKTAESVTMGMEVVGKKTQIGSLEDLLWIYDKFDGKWVKPVIDFAHLHAREKGYFLKQENIKKTFDILKSYPKILNSMHIHMSGIEYTDKGERRHLMLDDKESDFPYKKILKELNDADAKGTVICESPDIIGDALVLKRTYEKI